MLRSVDGIILLRNLEGEETVSYLNLTCRVDHET